MVRELKLMNIKALKCLTHHQIITSDISLNSSCFQNTKKELKGFHKGNRLHNQLFGAYLEIIYVNTSALDECHPHFRQVN